MKTNVESDEHNTIETKVDTIEESLLPESKSIWKVPLFKAKSLNTILLCLPVFINGFCSSMYGPTLPQLARNCGVSSDDIGWIFAARASVLFTALIVGYVLDHYKKKEARLCELCSKTIITIGLIFMSFSTFMIPWISSLVLITLNNAVLAIGQNMTGLAGNVSLVWIWKDRVDPAMQLYYACYGLGSILAPLAYSAVDSVLFAMYGQTKEIEPGIFDKKLTVTVTFIGLGILGTITTILCLFIRFRNIIEYNLTQEAAVELKDIPLDVVDVDPIEDNSEQVVVVPEQSSDLEKIKVDQNKKERIRNVLITIITGLALMIYVAAEYGFGSLLYLYVVDKKRLTDEKSGAIMNSAFWFFFTVGRVIAIPTSLFLSGAQMLIIAMIGGFLSSTALVFLKNSIVCVWIFSILFGLSLSSQYPTTITLPRTYMGVVMSGSMTSIVVLAGQIGAVLGPFLITQSTKISNNDDSFIYTVFGASAVASILYIVLLVFFKRTKTA
ncbi:sodium-dependent glucose transporter [Acrasis kona]|uniref:Sodium-dependent glucose transporter n=1 Tax=Acrasis kona TaxID=1008807 RepID=A0AAW2Z767_9EUKA